MSTYDKAAEKVVELMDKYESRFRSRKFILTSFISAAAVTLCAFGKLGDTATASVLSTAILAYNLSNAWQSKKG